MVEIWANSNVSTRQRKVRAWATDSGDHVKASVRPGQKFLCNVLHIRRSHRVH
ncbi:uncharacterized protein METZ01_LOCUS93423, partial [marine metagenome]